MALMASKGKPSPRSAVSPLSDEQVKRLAARHTLVDSTQYYPTGPRTPNQPEINAQNPQALVLQLARNTMDTPPSSRLVALGFWALISG